MAICFYLQEDEQSYESTNGQFDRTFDTEKPENGYLAEPLPTILDFKWPYEKVDKNSLVTPPEQFTDALIHENGQNLNGEEFNGKLKKVQSTMEVKGPGL